MFVNVSFNINIKFADIVILFLFKWKYCSALSALRYWLQRSCNCMMVTIKALIHDQLYCAIVIVNNLTEYGRYWGVPQLYWVSTIVLDIFCTSLYHCATNYPCMQAVNVTVQAKHIFLDWVSNLPINMSSKENREFQLEGLQAYKCLLALWKIKSSSYESVPTRSMERKKTLAGS